MERFLRGCGRVELNEFISGKNPSIHMKSNGAALESSKYQSYDFFNHLFIRLESNLFQDYSVLINADLHNLSENC